jgi:hypothetical protein
MAQNNSGGKKNNAPSSPRRPSQKSSAKSHSESNSFDLKSAIASKLKNIIISSDKSQNKAVSVQSAPKKTSKTLSQEHSKLTEAQPTADSNVNRTQKIKIGNILDTSKMESPRPPAKSVQRKMHNSYLTSQNSSASQNPLRNRGDNSSASGRRRSGELTFSSFMSEYTKKLWVRILLITFAVLFLIYLVYQMYLNYYSDVKTEIATISTYSETIDTEGIAIRDEFVINEKLSSSSVSAVENGAKVSKGQTVINTFNSSQAAAAYKRIAEIDEEISELQSMANSSEDSANEVTNIESQLDEQITSLAQCVNDGSLNKISDLKGNITYLMNKRLVSMRKVEDYQERIDSLEQEKQSLEAVYSEEPTTINASSSGYYVDSLDGYENLLSISTLPELTVSKLNSIMDKEVTTPENLAGKLITDFSWYLACPVSAKEAEDYLSIDSAYTLVLPYSETGSVQGLLTYLNDDGSGSYLAIFRCSSLLSELCTIRRQPVKIQIRSYNGFNIKKSALHIRVTTVESTDEDGNVTQEEIKYPCVYTIVGNQVVAKKVNILYNGDKTVICSYKENESNYLALYDKVITEGKGLYAGKIIN